MQQPAELRISFANSVIRFAGSTGAEADNQTEAKAAKRVLSERMHHFIITHTTADSTIYWSKLETHSTNRQKESATKTKA